MSEEMQTDTPQPATESPETPAPETASAPAEPEPPIPEAVESAKMEAEGGPPLPAEGGPTGDPAASAVTAPPAGQAPRPPRGERSPRERRPERETRGDRPPQSPQGERGKTGGGGNERRAGDSRGGGERPRDGGPRPSDRDRRPEMRRPEGPVEIEYDKLVNDSLYLDNQAHVLVARLRDLDAGTRSQLRRLYSAVRRACRAPESDRQHQFVMLRARLAYTIARHGLRSLDPLEKLLLQVTRRNETRGYDRFRDLFEAIIAYNE